MKTNEKNQITLQQYENVKNLFIKFWGVDNKRISKILNKTPKAFIKYINRYYELKTSYQVIIIDTESEFIATRDTEEQAKELYNKWLAICGNAKVEFKQVEYLKLK